jgi:hypothetical protein
MRLPLIEALDLRPPQPPPEVVYAIFAPMQFGGFKTVELWGDWEWRDGVDLKFLRNLSERHHRYRANEVVERINATAIRIIEDHVRRTQATP